jgi:hypothetical protein
MGWESVIGSMLMMYEAWNTRKWLVAHDNIEKNKARKVL